MKLEKPFQNSLANGSDLDTKLPGALHPEIISS